MAWPAHISHISHTGCDVGAGRRHISDDLLDAYEAELEAEAELDAEEERELAEEEAAEEASSQMDSSA